LGRAPLLTRRAAERALSAIGVAAFFVAGYFGVGLSLDPARARELRTALDDRIPFVAGSVWIYLWVFPAAFLPLFVVRSQELFRRTILAYATAIAASIVMFIAIPVTSAHLRADRASLDATRASPWAVLTLYRIDPPLNLFPSLHLSIATLAALSALKARKAYGAAAFAGVGFIAVSICTVKQHFVADGIAGVALAAIVYRLVLRAYAPSPGTDPAYGWRGPAAYGALLAAVYAGLYAWFLSA
jgi:hypothetical protein